MTGTSANVPARRRKTWLWANLLLVGYAGLVTAGIVLATRDAWLAWIEHWTGDWRTALLSDRQPSQHPSVAVVLIGEETLERYPYRLPIDRRLLASLVTAVDAAGAKTIGLDFMFTQATEPAKDDALLEALTKAKARVVLGAGDERIELPKRQVDYQDAFLKKAGRPAGYVNLQTDADRTVRYIPPAAPVPRYPQSFAEVVAGTGSGHPPNRPRRIAWLLHPPDGSDTFLTVPAELLGESATEQERALAQQFQPHLKDRVVLIGADLADVDVHRTPLNDRDGSTIPGVMVHAHVAAQFLDGRAVRLVAEPVSSALLFALVLAGGVLGRRHGFLGYTLYGGTVIAAVIGADSLLFVLRREILPFNSCFAALLLGVLGGFIVRALFDRAAKERERP